MKQLYAVWLAEALGPANGNIKKLLEAYGDAEQVYQKDAKALQACPFLSAKERQALLNKEITRAKEILALCQKQGYRLVTLEQPAYPDRLRNIYDPPEVLYVYGDMPDFDRELGIAAVGTRRSTRAAQAAAHLFAGALTRGGALIVSGLARGLDTAAHLSALAAGGETVAVLGGGFDHMYPPENEPLMRKIAAHGAVLSEYAPDVSARPEHFPARNRIIAGLCAGCLILQAPRKSGALITARLAAEQGRDVFVLPGDLFEPLCAGSNELAARGEGWLVTSAVQILDEYSALYGNKINRKKAEISDKRWAAYRARLRGKMVSHSGPGDFLERLPEKKKIRPAQRDNPSGRADMPPADPHTEEKPDPGLTPEEKKVYDILTFAPMAFDEAVRLAALPVAACNAAVTMLEIKGLAAVLPGRRLIRLR